MSEEPRLTLEVPEAQDEEVARLESPPNTTSETLRDATPSPEPVTSDEARESQQEPEDQVPESTAPDLPPKASQPVPADNFSEVSLNKPSSDLESQQQEGPDRGEQPQPTTDAPSQSTPESSASQPENASPSAPEAPEKDHGTPQPSQGAQMTRSESTATTLGGRDSTSSTHSRPLLSGVLMQSALDQILASKEARKNASLKATVEAALTGLKNTPHKMDSRALLAPLKLACDTGSNQLCILSLDCIGKLVTFSAAASSDGDLQPQKPVKPDPRLAEEIVDLVCDCFIEAPTPNSSNSGPEAVNLHILSALLSLILSPNPALPVHQSSLLKAVRTVYNIFLLSKGQQNQMVAQGALGQMVTAVFSRVSSDAQQRPSSPEETPETPRPANTTTDGQFDSAAPETADGEQAHQSETEQQPQESQDVRPEEGGEEEARPDPKESVESKAPAPEEQQDVKQNGDSVTLQSLEQANTSVEVLPEVSSASAVERLSPEELHARDAFLVFRALCKLSMKPLGSESERDLKSHAMRSKLLSLQLIRSILHAYMPIFESPHVLLHNNTGAMSFGSAVKQYLCLALSRNAVSPVIQVFELSCEIFWRVVMGMRRQLKKEIEVLINEIFLPILEMRNSTVRQKSILLATLCKLCEDPQTLVDIYINYDCDRSSIENVYERMINSISRIGTTPYTTVTPAQPSTGSGPGPGDIVNAPAGSGIQIGLGSQEKDPFGNMPYEQRLKRQSLEALVFTLRSLVSWAGKGAAGSGVGASVISPPALSTSVSALQTASQEDFNQSNEDIRPPLNRASISESDLQRPASAASGQATPDYIDDPERFETAKQRKTTLIEGIKRFNAKPKKGVTFFLQHGFIPSNSHGDIAAFLMQGDGLSKAAIGEYLGGADDDVVATMHAFVDLLDFTGMSFTEALRVFLQSFRLPGEAQVIDRYMLKFADRYMVGNPKAFANADTAYVLAYSVIMLNTDLYNPVNKTRMTQADFIKNNRGIDDGKDLPEDMLISIYNDIANTEIRMKDEIDLSGLQQSGGFVGALAGVGRDLQREAYMLESEGMATKTEGLFRTMLRSQRRGGAAARAEQFYSASHFEHVRPMFTVAWMSILAGISAPMQSTDDSDLVQRSLEGFKLAIKIVCLFDMELERNAFVTTLAKFTFLNNYGEMKSKNVEAIKALLDVAIVDGNYLKGSWRDVIACVSQLERLNLITSGVDSSSLPDLGRRPGQTPSKSLSKSGRRQSVLAAKPTAEVANETRSASITIASDRIFSTSNSLSGTAIVDFAQALADVSWEEIQASGLTEHPRTFCLQKLVEISYYNMNRIRLEWSNIWAVLGDHFNQVCCHTNLKVSFFALDSLRQLASRFLEKEELANFKFQKDFLKPFEYAMVHNSNPDVRDMILQCIRQMIQARAANFRSGWHTMFGVFSAASRVLAERIASQAFDMVKMLNRQHFSDIISFGSFADLAVCITDFCKINKYQKISLHAIEMLKGLVPQMLSCPECPVYGGAAPKDETQPVDDPMIKFWYPVLFGFYDITMNGEDLEVRKRALDYLFETLKRHGESFPEYFWDLVCKEVLFPIFSVLRSRNDVSRFTSHEDMSVWLSTTMIQALRSLVDLFTFYFDVLGRMLDRLLSLLCDCICQENDTLARIGTSCLQQLIENNVQKLTPELWEKIISTLTTLFATTTAHQLFDPRLRAPSSPRSPAHEDASEKQQPQGSFVAPIPLSPGGGSAAATDADATAPIVDRKRVFRQVIVKCVLQLLLIETAHELLQNEDIYTTIPPAELLRLMSVLEDSYRFSKKFNANKDLRTALWKVGFMKQLPNLLKQESSSAATLVTVLLRLYTDDRPDHVSKRGQVVESFTPLGLQIISNYISLDGATQARNIAAWTPVVTEVLQGFASFEDGPLSNHVDVLYPLAVDLLSTELAPEVRESLRTLLYRIGVVRNLIALEETEDGSESEEDETEEPADTDQSRGERGEATAVVANDA